jgi:hypothetical protein
MKWAELHAFLHQQVELSKSKAATLKESCQAKNQMGNRNWRIKVPGRKFSLPRWLDQRFQETAKIKQRLPSRTMT